MTTPERRDPDRLAAREAAIEAIAAALYKNKSVWGREDARTAIRVLLDRPDLLRALVGDLPSSPDRTPGGEK